MFCAFEVWPEVTNILVNVFIYKKKKKKKIPFSSTMLRCFVTAPRRVCKMKKIHLICKQCTKDSGRYPRCEALMTNSFLQGA